MTGAPFFSVVIPTYNRELKLERALASLFAQTFKSFEVIVCDDGSTDGTRGLCEAWSGRLDICYLYDGNSGGPAGPRNRGVSRARGEWICFLDSDDWWLPRKLERTREVAERADVIYHDCRSYSGPGCREQLLRGRSLRSPVFDDLMVGWNALSTSATSVRRSVLQQAGGFDEDRRLIAVEDFDLWLRIARVTERFVYLPETLAVYAVEGDNLSRFTEANAVRESAVFERHVGFLDGQRQKLALRMLRYRQGLVYWHIGEGRKSREMFMAALLPARWRHRFFIVPWIIATFFCKRKAD